ncbi:head-tail connector protein [Streptomyces phage SF1]|uniref:Uncharacterized protein n=2 Tax=Caudoviricetes TaxID=2731619 RepID=A0A0K1Y591_9CAUD|nr:hypothetical protein [Streptomyces sp. SPB78]YP_009199276.1 head-tail connector protein [Streptomyces phage SF1]YP_009213135.1 head-tail connector protein [Streptomyces phage SF3]AKY02177.1 hypothetical protein SF1_280 [Streptomyces phage SF1]ALF00139.1 hypothetical protein SF3_80 [Streptomyces phage SF3]
MTARRLIAYVHVAGAVYGPGDDVPPEAARRIGAHAWATGDDQGDGGEQQLGDQAPAPSEAPPRSGRGSGAEAWRRFAEQHDVEVPADATREDVIAACEAAGVIDPEV